MTEDVTAQNIVLIDTWWNVNSSSGYRSKTRVFSFNRYMVECECWLDISMVLCVRVLIDTWWNVNVCAGGKAVIRIFVLIDTWWNVNVCAGGKAVIRIFVLIDTWWNVN